MSDDTKANLEAALHAHIADEQDGRIVTDWAMVVASTTVEDIGTGATFYQFQANTGQPAHVSYGLLSYALHSAVWDEDEE